MPVDGKKVQEIRLTFGTKERELLQDLTTSYRIEALDIKGMLQILEDPSRVVQIAYGIATVIELLGIETGLPTVADLPELVQWLKEKDAMGKDPAESGNPSMWQLLLDLWTEGYPGGY